MTATIDVDVYVFERESSGGRFTQVKQDSYKTTVNEDRSYELPVVVLEKDAQGNTLKYVACNVNPTALPITEERAKKPKRSVVAKAPKAVVAPAPDPTPDPVPATKQKRKSVDTIDEAAFWAAVKSYM